MSTAFLCAMLFLWGVWPAMLSVGIASLAADLRAHKQWWKVLFNPAQYAVSVGAAYLVIYFIHGPISLEHSLPTLDRGDLVWIPLAWATYYVINNVIVSCVLTFAHRLLALLRDDFVHDALMSFSVMAISPIIVVVAMHSWLVMPLLLIPLLLLYYTASMSLDREHAAGHDDLTGLPNRNTLRFELEDALATYERDGVPFGLMLIDMNDFKRVNDTLGHQVGDRLLVEFANRLRQQVRPGDFVARLGGDEFAIIVFDTDEAVGRAVAERLCTSISHSIDLGGLSLEAEASIGLAMCPAHGTDGGTLLRRADVAMYTAKANRTRVEVYSPARDMNSADALGLLSELRQALADDALELYYQPKVSTAEGTPIGVEALIRWNHPVRGFVAPDEFIPLAEGSGIMPAAHRARREPRTRPDCALARRGHDGARGGQHRPDRPDRLGTAARGRPRPARARPADQGCSSSRSPNASSPTTMDDAKRNLADLRDLGVSISLDDFGTGYSSLLRLSSLPVDEIKIDRGFISAMSQGDRAIGIVRALIDLAHTLGMPAIAEGVETASEMRLLETLGCDGVQGWHVARPMPADEVTTWLRERAAHPLAIVHDDEVPTLRAV